MGSISLGTLGRGGDQALATAPHQGDRKTPTQPQCLPPSPLTEVDVEFPHGHAQNS